MDASAIKAELKAFERDFRAEHNRDPTYDEIKQRPAIAEKYKLYKKIVKASSSKPIIAASAPRSSSSPKPNPLSSILPKSRAVITESPAKTSNPFSPAKAKRVKNFLSPVASGSSSSALVFPQLSASRQANPFITPTKSKSKLPTRPQPHAVPTDTTLEEDPFPLIQSSLQVPSLPQNSTQPSDSHHHTYDTSTTTTTAERAVSRARKRLRGEPVSPSPVKEKRPRVAASHPISQNKLTFVEKHPSIPGQDDHNDTDVDDRDQENADEDTSYLDDSPVKPLTRSANGKPFVTLFEDASIILPGGAKRPSMTTTKSQSRSKSSLSFSQGLFQRKSRAISPDELSGDEDVGAGEGMDAHMDVDMDESWNTKGKIKALNFSLNARRSTSRVPTKSQLLPQKSTNRLPRAASLVPSKSAGAGLSRTASAISGMVPKPPGNDASMIRSSMKRPSSDAEPEPEDHTETAELPPASSTSKLSFLPPSPPPADSSTSRWANKDKGKGRAYSSSTGAATTSRKKSKLSSNVAKADETVGSEDSPEDEDIHVKVVDWRSRARPQSQQKLSHIQGDENTDITEEEDWSLSAFATRQTHIPNDVSVNDGDGRYEVNLPDDLKRVLALSPRGSKAGEHTEVKLAKELIYGTREMHFDSRKGAEIWDVGEDHGDEAGGTTGGKSSGYEGYGEDDGDWEGEPVPWEVAEL